MKNKNTIQRAAFYFLFALSFQYAGAQRNGVVPVSNYDTVSNLFSVAANKIPLSTSKYKDIHYATFQQSGNAIITIKCSEEIKEYTISPLSKNIRGKLINKNAIQFNLNKPSYLVIRVNNKERLFLFAEQLTKETTSGVVSILQYKVDTTGKELNTGSIQQAINETSQKKQTLFFPPGIYKAGRLVIPSNAKIFLAAGALIKASGDISNLETPDHQRSKGFINILNAENVTISGLGMIDGSGRQLRDKYGDQARMRLIFLSGSRNVTINGITERDPGSWNTQIMYSDHISFRNVKLINDVNLSNTDGFDPDASSFVTIENCFAYCGDDNVAIKITQENGASNLTSDITVKGCVFLTRKSSLKVGTESRGITIKNILFENNDVVMSDRGMALYCSDGAVYDNIRYINNRFEENYPDAKKMGIHFTINKRNPDSKAGIMKNVIIHNCRFYQRFPKKSEIEGLDETHTIAIQIKNLFIEGKKCVTLDSAGITTSFSNVEIK